MRLDHLLSKEHTLRAHDIRLWGNVVFTSGIVDDALAGWCRRLLVLPVSQELAAGGGCGTWLLVVVGRGWHTVEL